MASITPVVPPAAPVDLSVAAPKIKKTRLVHPKDQKTIDALKAKNLKLTEDAKSLKKQVSELRSAHSRIRRIPKTAAAADDAAVPAADA